MNSQVKSIGLKYCRGIVGLKIKLTGQQRHFLLFGGNGKCKSSIVTGLEWLYGGSVEGIKPGALKHIDAGDEDASVEVALADNKGFIRREIASGAVVEVVDDGAAYFDTHPSPDSFILRRSKLLSFLNEQPRNRYQRVIGLLGIDWLNDTQDAFNKVADKTQQVLAALTKDLSSLYGQFPMKEDTGAPPESQQDLLAICNLKLKEVGRADVKSLDDLKKCEAALYESVSPEVRDRLIVVEKSLALLGELNDIDWGDDITELNENRDELRQTAKAIPNIAEAPLLRSAIGFFEEHPDLIHCPVCERGFTDECSQVDVFKKLTDRANRLGQFQEIKTVNAKLTAKCFKQIEIDLRDITKCLDSIEKSIAKEKTEELRDCLSELSNQVAPLKTPTADKYEYPQQAINEVSRLVGEIKTDLANEQKQLSAASPTDVAIALASVTQTINALPLVEKLEASIAKAELTAGQAEVVKNAFTESKKAALAAILDKIADRVKLYYDSIHIDDSRVEGSECTGISLKATNRGKMGSLEFRTEFLETVKNCDPQTYLSEGHLDSLGLCIYLATVKEFNEPGSLLVIDDVLTSVDQEHRHRVTELLLTEFEDYQLVVTTHDQAWFDRLVERIRNSVNHCGKWKIVEFAHWTRENGPILAPDSGAKAALKKAQVERGLRHAGGPIRIVTESFCKKAADAVGLKVAFQKSGLYTVVDFKNARLSQSLQDAIENDSKRSFAEMEDRSGPIPEENRKKFFAVAHAEKAYVETVLGAAFLNQLVHDKPDLSALQEDELQAFTDALLRLDQSLNARRLDQIRFMCTGR